MDNLAREPKEEHAKVIRFIDIDKERPGNWQYVDVDEFEFNIRQDEAAKWVARRQRERQRQRDRKEAVTSMILATLVFRIVSLIIFVVCAAISHAIGNSMLVVTVAPMCLIGVWMPGYNNVDDLVDKYEKYIRKKR